MKKETIHRSNGETYEKVSYDGEEEFLQKINRILSGNVSITVKSAKLGNGIPAYTQGNKIVIDMESTYRKTETQTGDRDLNFVTGIKGLNYHELGHVLFTNVNFKKDVVDNGFLISRLNGVTWSEHAQISRCLNLLEDAKIENWMIVRYPNSKPYYVHNVLTHILTQDATTAPSMAGMGGELENKERLFSYFLLLNGRYFVSRDLIRKLEKEIIKHKVAKKEVVEEVKEIFEKYCKLHDAKEQIVLTLNLHDLLRKNNKTPPALKHQEANSTAQKSNSKNKETQEDFKKSLKELKEEEQKQQKQQNKETGKGEKSEKSETQDGQKQTDAPTKDSEEAIKQIVQEVKEQKQTVQQEVNDESARDMKTINQSVSCGEQDSVEVKSTVFSPSNENKIVSLRMKRMIRTLRNGLESRYEPHKKTGRLNLRNIMTNRNLSTNVFKKYHPSRLGKSKMGVVLLLDSSGSMGDNDFDLCLQSVWSLNNALTQCADKTMIIEYSTDSKILKSFASNKSDLRRHFYEGTNPLESLERAYKNCMNLRKTENIKNNIVFILTDGAWANQERSGEVLQKMKNANMHTVLIAPRELIHSHPVCESYSITKFSEVEGVCRKVIKDVQQKLKLGAM